jgi:hypothetical protein
MQSDIPADDFIAKPFDLSTLIETLDSLTGRSRH